MRFDRRWRQGELIMVDEVWRGRLWAARPVLVVSDVDDRLVLWSPKGTRRKVPVTPPTRVEPLTRGERSAELLTRLDWEFGWSVWDVSTLWLLREGAAELGRMRGGLERPNPEPGGTLPPSYWAAFVLSGDWR